MCCNIAWAQSRHKIATNQQSLLRDSATGMCHVLCSCLCLLCVGGMVAPMALLLLRIAYCAELRPTIRRSIRLTAERFRARAIAALCRQPKAAALVAVVLFHGHHWEHPGVIPVDLMKMVRNSSLITAVHGVSLVASRWGC